MLYTEHFTVLVVILIPRYKQSKIFNAMSKDTSWEKVMLLCSVVSGTF